MISPTMSDFVRQRIEEDLARTTTAQETAEAEAKQRILDIALGLELRLLALGDDEAVPNADVIVRLLAATYAQHPDYRDEWKPPPWGSFPRTPRRSFKVGRVVVLWT